LVWGQAVEVRGVVGGRCDGVGGVHSGSDAGELDVREAYRGRWGSPSVCLVCECASLEPEVLEAGGVAAAAAGV
jgi:hypothetical protein